METFQSFGEVMCTHQNSQKPNQIIKQNLNIFLYKIETHFIINRAETIGEKKPTSKLRYTKSMLW